METGDKNQQQKTEQRPRIYVASLSDYNAGTLHGRWIFADRDADAIRAEIAEMLAESTEPDAEEYAIHDYDNFGGLRLGEFEDLERVTTVAGLLIQHGPLFGKLMDHFGGTSGLEEARDYMEHGYCGAFDDIGWYAAELGNDLYHEQVAALPDFIRNNIDWDAIGRDLELGGDVFTLELDGVVHVFDAHL